MNYKHNETNKIVKNKLDRLIMINLLVEYGRELEKVRLTEKDILNEETLINNLMMNFLIYIVIIQSMTKTTHE